MVLVVVAVTLCHLDSLAFPIEDLLLCCWIPLPLPALPLKKQDLRGSVGCFPEVQKLRRLPSTCEIHQRSITKLYRRSIEDNELG